MSFILDALKKSENDRQRQSGPALYEAKLTAPRTQLPLWAIGLGVVLVANLGLVMWVLFRPSHEGHAAQASTPSQDYTQPAVTQAGPPPQYAPNAPAYAPNGQAPSQPGMPTQGAPVNQGQGVGAQPMQMQAPGAAQAPGSAQPPAQPGTAVPGQNSLGSAQAANDQSSNPDDYAPAAEPNNSSGFHVRKATDSGVQLYSDAAANGGLPELRVDMHTYALRPQDRFVLINMKKAREGDMLPEGVKVESITPDGVVVSRNGSQFLLPK